MELLDRLTLEEKLWQMLFISQDELTDVYGPTMAGEGTREALGHYPVGGVIYFSQNMISGDQVATLVGNTQSYSKIPLFIGVDEEGGTVSRLSPIGVTNYVSPMAEYGEAGDKEAVYELGQTFARQLLSVGFNLNFAPVADVVTNPNNQEIGNRSFSDDPVVAGEMVAEMVKGLQEGGVISCLKHFPGHGSTEDDSHYGMSVSNRTLEDLRAEEFLPFMQGIEAGVELVMMSHMSLPEVTGDNTPCDLSYSVVTELLREELGFEGLIFSDSHEMAAITSYYSCGEAAAMAVLAGCDVVLMPTDKQAAFDGLLKAVANGSLTEERINESVLRILTLKCKYGIIPADF
jgi:beta-N-acetylhexosaminidase